MKINHFQTSTNIFNLIMNIPFFFIQQKTLDKHQIY